MNKEKIVEFLKKNVIAIVSVLIALILLITIAIVAINKDDEDEKEDKLVEVSGLVIGENAQVGDYQLRIIDIKKDYSTAGFENPGNGKQFIKVLVDLRNSGDEDAQYSQEDFVVKDSNDTEYTAQLLRIDTTSGDEGILPSEGYLQGFLVFKVPKGEEYLKIEYTPQDDISIKISVYLVEEGTEIPESFDTKGKEDKKNEESTNQKDDNEEDSTKSETTPTNEDDTEESGDGDDAEENNQGGDSDEDGENEETEAAS